MGGEIVTRAFYPLPLFPTVSVTGTRCMLMCPYCRGTLLRGMPSADTPMALDRLLTALESSGALGVQLSGGFTAQGRLPLEGMLGVVGAHSGRLYVIAHDFLVDREEAARMRAAGIRRVDFPLTLNPEVLGVRGLKASPRIVEESFEALLDKGPSPVPHVLVGELAGKPSGEEDAIRYAAELGVDLVVIIVFTPLPGTPWAGAAPPTSSRVMEILRIARKLLPGEVALGCMRPREVREKVDVEAVEEGLVDRIVAPSPRIRRLERYAACCSVDSASLPMFRLPVE